MKLLFLTAVFSLLTKGIQAQTQHLFSLSELEQLASCPDQPCFQRTVQSAGYQYRKQDSEVTDSTAFHAYFNRQMEPYRAESFVIQQRLPDMKRQVIFSTNNKAFPQQLDADIRANNYVSTGPADAEGAREYSHQAGNLVWILRREKPSFSRVSENFIITLYSITTPVSPTGTLSSVSPSATSTLPHLGGEWDAKYPIQNAAGLLNAERQYAAEYDRKQGKTGHTFFRVEKVRVQSRRTGQYRPLTDRRWDESFDLALRRTGFDTFANERKRLYQREALFDIGGERIWVPIQESLIGSVEKEARPGSSIVLYAVLVSYHDFGGTLHLSFLVNEFAAANKITPATNVTPQTTSQPFPSSSVLAINRPSTPGAAVEDFNVFIRRFSSDRNFQLARIRFPMVWKELTNDETIVHRETAGTWQHYEVLKPAASDLIISVKSPTAQKPNDASVFTTCHLACGFADQLFFKRIGGKWHCVAREMMNG